LNKSIDQATIELSVVTTLYQSAPYIEEFYSRMSKEAQKVAAHYEIIMVDDGSPDQSLEIALKLADSDPRLKIIELSRNFGHHKAMMTGIDYARGKNIFLIDVDLEEPPELLEKFHAQLHDGNWDVVYGYQNERKGGLLEKWAGAIAWWLINILLPTKVPNNHSTVRLMNSNYARALVSHKERKTAIGGLWVETGYKQTGLSFTKLSRSTSSYRPGSRLIVLLDSITSFSERPLYIIFFLGLIIVTLSAIVSTGLVIQFFSGKTLPGWISVMASVWLLGGLGIFCIGVVGLYISRIFIETKMRPYTIVRQIYNGNKYEVTN
jgi:putative glycosyltransferase